MIERPGYKTTEFWVTLMTSLIGIVTLFRPINVTQETIVHISGIVAVLVSGIAYIYSRTIIKKSESQMKAIIESPETRTITTEMK